MQNEKSCHCYHLLLNSQFYYSFKKCPPLFQLANVGFYCLRLRTKIDRGMLIKQRGGKNDEFAVFEAVLRPTNGRVDL